jgi:hypothetical protein
MKRKINQNISFGGYKAADEVPSEQISFLPILAAIDHIGANTGGSRTMDKGKLAGIARNHNAHMADSFFIAKK